MDSQIQQLHIWIFYPPGFRKIRYYGFLNNRSRKKNLSVIFRIQGHQRFTSSLAGLSMTEILRKVWGHDVRICPACGRPSMRLLGKTYILNA